MGIINDVPNDSCFATCVFTVLLFRTLQILSMEIRGP